MQGSLGKSGTPLAVAAERSFARTWSTVAYTFTAFFRNATAKAVTDRFSTCIVDGPMPLIVGHVFWSVGIIRGPARLQGRSVTEGGSSRRVDGCMQGSLRF
jgi:hypothetical protein